MDENLAFRAEAEFPESNRPADLSFPMGMSAACLSALIDELDVGMLICEAGGRLVHANAAGYQELRWSSLLTLLPDDHVGAIEPRQRLALTSAIAAALAGRRQLLLLKNGDERVMMAVQPLSKRPQSAPRVLLLLGRRSMAPSLVVEMLCQLHDITSAEQRVLDGLLHGHPVGGLAELFGVKVSTVRTQVASLRSKLGVHRLSDALRLAAELPPMAGALRYQPRTGPRAAGRAPS